MNLQSIDFGLDDTLLHYVIQLEIFVVKKFYPLHAKSNKTISFQNNFGKNLVTWVYWA